MVFNGKEYKNFQIKAQFANLTESPQVQIEDFTFVTDAQQGNTKTLDVIEKNFRPSQSIVKRSKIFSRKYYTWDLIAQYAVMSCSLQPAPRRLGMHTISYHGNVPR